jgi:L-rhamnose mutarotase
MLVQELERAGVRKYSIMLHPGTSQLFAFAEYDNQAKWDAVAQTDACQRWWRFMGDIMPSNPDHSPVAEDLTEVFYMEGPGSEERA